MKYIFTILIAAVCASQASNRCVSFFEPTAKISMLTRVLGNRFLINEGIASGAKKLLTLQGELRDAHNNMQLLVQEKSKLQLEFEGLDFSEIARLNGIVENRTGFSRIFGSKTDQFIDLKMNIVNDYNLKIRNADREINNAQKIVSQIDSRIFDLRSQLNSKILSFWTFLTYLPEAQLSESARLASLMISSQKKIENYIRSTTEIVRTFEEILKGMNALNHIGWETNSEVKAYEASYKAFKSKRSTYRKSVQELEAAIDEIKAIRVLMEKIGLRKDLSNFDKEVKSLVDLLIEVKEYENGFQSIENTGHVLPRYVHSWKNHMINVIYTMNYERLTLDVYLLDLVQDLQ